MKMATTTKMHKDDNGIDVIWSVYQARWIPAMYATDADIAALPRDEAERTTDIRTAAAEVYRAL
jgi:hypothetical protein